MFSSTGDTPPGAAEPFTKEQLWRGALHAWIAFMVLMIVVLTAAFVISDLVTGAPMGTPAVAILPIVLIYAIFIGGAVSLVVTLIGVPVAGLLGLALRRVGSRAAHLAAFAGLGAAIGGIAVLLFWAASPGGTYLLDMFGGVTVVVCGAATLYGRWRAMRPARAPRDPDAATEDAASALLTGTPEA